MKKIAITGGAGFLGSTVARMALEKDMSVVILDDFSNGKELFLQGVTNHKNLKVIHGDITNIENVESAFTGCDAVIHLAVLDLRQSIKDPFRVNEVIVNGTLNCLHVALQQGIKIFLNCSSSETYGTAQYAPMDEKHPLNPETPYAAAKVAQDMYVSSFGNTYGLPWVTVRPFNMYGPNSHWEGVRGELIPKMIVRAMNKAPLVIFGDGSQSRDFIYVDDASRAILEILDREDMRSASFNICSGKDTQIKSIAKLICESFELDPKEIIQHQESRPGDVQRHIGDCSLFKSYINDFEVTNLENGLRSTISWFRELPFQPEDLLKQEVLRNWE